MSGSRGRLRPILVVHGALGSAGQMRQVADALAEPGNPVTVVELPGHGETPLPKGIEFSMEAFADAIAAAAARVGAGHGDAVHATKPVVFGYSMGGYAALMLEARTAGTLAGIVTFGTKFEWTPEVAALEVRRLDADVISARVPKFAMTLEARHKASGGWRLLLERTAGLLQALGNAPALDAGSLARVDIPVTIAVGARDDTVSVEEAERAAHLMRNASSVVLEDVPHPIERVPPAAVQSLVRGMLSRVA